MLTVKTIEIILAFLIHLPFKYVGIIITFSCVLYLLLSIFFISLRVYFLHYKYTVEIDSGAKRNTSLLSLVSFLQPLDCMGTVPQY